MDHVQAAGGLFTYLIGRQVKVREEAQDIGDIRQSVTRTVGLNHAEATSM
jgi:hypothetical protein